MRNWGQLIRDGFSVRANILADAYRRCLHGRLADLPGSQPGTPRFVFVATNVVTGLNWQFHAGPEARMGDFYFGYRPVACTGLAEAVAASSAFPPGFSALHPIGTKRLVCRYSVTAYGILSHRRPTSTYDFTHRAEPSLRETFDELNRNP